MSAVVYKLLMNNNFQPWTKYPPLTRERLSILAAIIREVRGDAVLLHDPAAGDNEWCLGCRVYARTCSALEQAAERFEWLTILPEAEKPLRFTFAIGSIPIRFYRGLPTDPPGNYISRSYVEIHQQQLAFQIDGIRLVDQILRIAVEIDGEREVSGIFLVEMDNQGEVTETYQIPFAAEAGNVTPLRSTPINVPAPELQPLDKPEERKRKDRHAGSK